MTNKLEFVVKDQNNCIINGLITREYVNNIINLGDDFISDSSSPNFSFAGITSCDSSSVALIIHWWRLASLQQKEIAFNHISEDMLSIMRISNLGGLLKL